MEKSISVNQKRRGRPASGRDPAVAVRLPEDTIVAIDKRAGQNAATSRSEAIRRLVELALKGKSAGGREMGARRVVATEQTGSAGRMVERALAADPNARRARKG